MLSMAARKQFGVYADPFVDDVHDKGDVYLTDSVRYTSEYMYLTAKNAGMIAVIGESGSGKSTLRKLLIDRIQESGAKIRIIFPRTLDRTRLTAAAICDAIISDVSKQTPRRSFEAKCRQVETVLSESARAGWSHVLMIEEAHDLSIQTLKYLKRFWELEDGFKKLLGIVLIAQPELKLKLDESRNWEARELMELCPIGLFDYLKVMEKDKKYLPEEDIWGMMYDLVNAIGFMHKQDPPLVHRDLKLENVMQGKDGRWKLIDFGSVVFGTVKLATKDDVDREEEQIEKYTTQMYRAPEMVDFFGVSEITPKTDIWALGCILYTLMFLKQPFLNASKLAILGAKYTIPPRHRYSPELVDLLKRMLTPEPEKRASAVELFKIIKAKVGKRVPRRVQMVASNFRDDAVSEDESDEEESEFDDEVITEVGVGEERTSDS